MKNQEAWSDLISHEPFSLREQDLFFGAKNIGLLARWKPQVGRFYTVEIGQELAPSGKFVKKEKANAF